MRYIPQRVSSVVLILAVVGMILGCGGVQQAAARAKRANQLKAIGIAYHNYHDATAKGPAGIQDLTPYLAESPDAIQAVQSGDLVVLWNVKISDVVASSAGTSSTVLGYEKDVPTSGGQVLMADGSVKNMTAAEYSAASKPPAAGK